MAAARGTSFEIELNHAGRRAWSAPASRSSTSPARCYHLVDLETVLLQKLGPACVAAYNASAMCADLPKVAFLAMDARHCAGAEMAEMMAYAAAVGSAHARKVAGAIGFVGCATDATAPFFGQAQGHRHDAARADRLCRLDRARRRDVPRDLPGRAADRADRLFRPRDQRRGRGAPALSRAGRGGPPVASAWTRRAGAIARGSTSARSYEVLEAHAPQSIRGYRTEEELRYLVGTGVRRRRCGGCGWCSNEAGFPQVKIVASSGFGPAEVPDDGGRQRADRRDRHRLLPARTVDARPTPPPTSSPMTASRWSRPAANSCCGSAKAANRNDPAAWGFEPGSFVEAIWNWRVALLLAARTRSMR